MLLTSTVPATQPPWAAHNIGDCHFLTDSTDICPWHGRRRCYVDHTAAPGSIPAIARLFEVPISMTRVGRGQSTRIDVGHLVPNSLLAVWRMTWLSCDVRVPSVREGMWRHWVVDSWSGSPPSFPPGAIALHSARWTMVGADGLVRWRRQASEQRLAEGWLSQIMHIKSHAARNLKIWRSSTLPVSHSPIPDLESPSWSW